MAKKKKQTEEQSIEKKERMRTAKDVIDKWTHDARCDVGGCVVGYLDRILQKILEKPLTAFSSWGSIEQASRDDLAIPQHRVVYFKFRGRVVWDKRSRLDEVFGSTPPFVRAPLGGDDEEDAPEAAPRGDDDAHTPLQRYLRRAGLAAFEDVERHLRNPPFRCKVRPACLGGVEVYLVMYDDQLQFGSQKETERAPAALALDHCRGAIYEQHTNQLLCCAFDKFWEVGDRRAADVDLDDPQLEVAEKCDGLLVKVFHCGGAWRVASNGCVDAKRAAFRWGDDGAATTVGALFEDAKPPDLFARLDRARCYAFELCHPRARVVSPHAAPRLVHLCTRRLPSGEVVAGDDLGLPRPRLFASLRGAAAFRAAAAHLPAHVEGFVVTDSYGRRVKVKGAEYLAAHADRARAAARGFFELSSLLKPGWGSGKFPDQLSVSRLLPSLLEALRHEFPDAEAAVNDPRSAARLRLERSLAAALGTVERPARPATATNPDRPNYFVCLKIDDPGVVAKVRELQSALVARDARLAAGLQSPESLHLTLATARATTPTDVARLEATLAAHAPGIIEAIGVLALEGVHSFRARGHVVCGRGRAPRRRASSSSARSSRPRRRTSSGPASSASPSPTRRAASSRSRRPSRSPARACAGSELNGFSRGQTFPSRGRTSEPPTE